MTGLLHAIFSIAASDPSTTTAPASDDANQFRIALFSFAGAVVGAFALIYTKHSERAPQLPYPPAPLPQPPVAPDPVVQAGENVQVYTTTREMTETIRLVRELRVDVDDLVRRADRNDLIDDRQSRRLDRLEDRDDDATNH